MFVCMGGTSRERAEDGGRLRWLYLDLNSYFASVEQQLDPSLRGQPVIVVPVRSVHTCAIAASHEAKLHGVRTGTPVREALRLCPGLKVVDARPDIYVEHHHRVLQAVERHAPVDKVCSIDEVACSLSGPQRETGAALALALAIQSGVKRDVGVCLSSSIGVAPSRLLAKIAAGMKKPDGVTVLRADQLPGPLLGLRLKDLPGIGSRMDARLKAAGVKTVQALWEVSPRRARGLWGSVEGDRFWHGLHGTDGPETPTERNMISHGHVLAPELRALDRAREVARRLTVKLGSRLRRQGLIAGALVLTLDSEGGLSGSAERRFPATADTFVLLNAVNGLWRQAAVKLGGQGVRYVGVALLRVSETGAGQPNLFGWTPEAEEDPRALRLCRALDRLNQRFGKDAVTIGPKVAGLSEYLGAKIAFTRIPEREEFVE